MELLKKKNLSIILSSLLVLAGLLDVYANETRAVARQLTSYTPAMAALVGSSDEEFETMAEDIEAIYGDYLGSVTAGYDELASFMQEGWFLSFRSADDDLVTDLAALPTNFAGLKPSRDMTRQWMAAGSQISSSISGQISVLNNTHTALVATEITADVVLISTGVGAGGVAVRKVLIQQGGKQAAKMVLRGMATATGGLAIGFLSEQAMLKAGMSPGHAKLAMKGAELFFAYKMLKVARLANAKAPLEKPLALPSPKVQASWRGDVQYYKEGAATPIEHIRLRHWHDSTATLSKSNPLPTSRFTKDIGVRELKKLADEATTYGTRVGNSITHDFGRTIGTDPHGNPVTKLQIFLGQDGTVRTAYPF